MNSVTLDTTFAKTKIDRNIYGHFAEHLGRCIYEGIWVGPDAEIPNTGGIRHDVVEALRKIKVPVLRWPGGCFADEYHWRDGVGPRESRPAMINTHWGGVVENNHFGTHEFMDLCAMLDCEPYICGNVGSGTIQEMSQWIEYLTFEGTSPMTDLRRKHGREEPWELTYFGVGNESWGCGGRMSAEYYSDLYRRYSVYCRNYGENQLYKIACGANGNDYHWTKVLMERAAPMIDGLALHYYTNLERLPNGSRVGQATQFNEFEWIEILSKCLFMDELIHRHSMIMDEYDPDKRVAMIVDEWGTWYAVEPGTHPRFLYQQNTMRDALVAALTLDIFNRHCDRVRMANIAQTVNVLQAMVLTQKEKMLLTPSYHVFQMYVVHHDATMVPLEIECESYEHAEFSIPAISGSASIDQNGKFHITLSNTNPHKEIPLVININGMRCVQATGRVLSAPTMDAHNTFEEPTAVKPNDFGNIAVASNRLEVTMPPMSVAAIEVANE